MFKQILLDFALVLCIFSSTYAAPRNLQTEYSQAIDRLNVSKVRSLLDEGINISDAVATTITSIGAEIGVVAVNGVLAGTFSYVLEKTKDLDEYVTEYDGGSLKTAKISVSDVAKYEEILEALVNHGGTFYNSEFLTVLFAREMPVNLFEVMLPFYDKQPKTFSADDISKFMLYPHNKELSVAGLKKLKILLDSGAKVSGSGGRELYSNLIKASLSESLVHEDMYLKDSDVKYLKLAFDLLSRLGVNPGSRERSFWEVMGTKTPWEVLKDYRERHRNEPELVQRANEIERALPAPKN